MSEENGMMIRMRPVLEKAILRLIIAVLLACGLAIVAPLHGKAEASVVGVCPICGGTLEDEDWTGSNGTYHPDAYGCYNCGSHWDEYGNAQYINSEACEHYWQISVNQHINGYNEAHMGGYSEFEGVTAGANHCPDFSGSSYIYKVNGMGCVTSRITMTGSRSADNALANSQFGFSSTPAGYTWHHMGAFDVASRTCTMQLVESEVHRSISHWGACAQYKYYTGVSYAS